MKRIIIILIVVVVGSYFAYDYFQGEAKKKAEQITQEEARQKKREASHVAVAQMVSKYNAADDWEDKLRGGRTDERKKILTMDMENLWLINRPILFYGKIKDISNIDGSSYLMTLDGLGRFSAALVGLYNCGGSCKNISLRLKCPKNMIDSFLSANPKASSHIISAVAVIAKISKIETNLRKTEEGDEEEIKTGVGQGIDILMMYR